MPLCNPCQLRGDETPVDPARWELGYHTCLPCGDSQAKQRAKTRCVVPLNKSNYIHVTDYTLLAQLNPKRTT